VAADAARLPFADASFDFVTACLMLHHFRDADAIRLLRVFGRVARRAVLINDLERHWFPVLFIRAAAPVFARSPITRHDAPASVRQAFQFGELRDLAREAGFRDIEVRRHLPWFRLSMIARNSSDVSGE
jgi:ubiquinone/menaquinone biosynthesis C-methylase UbiE